MVQDAYRAASRNFAGFRGGDGRAWLLTIVRNGCYDRFEAEGHFGSEHGFRRGGTQCRPGRSLTLRPHCCWQREPGLLEGVLAELPAEYREVLVLRELDQLSYRDIANIAGTPLSTSGHASAGRAKQLQHTLLDYMEHWITWKKGAIDVITNYKRGSLPQRYQGRCRHLEVDFASAAISVDARPITLTRKEYELLTLLVQNAGEIIPRTILLMRVWGLQSAEARTRTLDVHIVRLRKKLGAYSSRYIETICGIGYRFQPFRERPSLPDHYGVPAIVQSAGACEELRELSA